jgi:hypothetical protein
VLPGMLVQTVLFATLQAMLWALGILAVFAPLAVRVYRSKT